MDEKMLELFKTLELPTDVDSSHFPLVYDCAEPFEKCTLFVDVPTVLSNSTAILKTAN